MEQKMKLGILGTGMIVKEFLPWLAGADSPFQVQALCSTQRSAPLAAELCARYHVPQCTTNYLELLQWVDVVYLAVPNLQHTRYAKVALEAGKHVIVEKPMAPTAATAPRPRKSRRFIFIDSLLIVPPISRISLASTSGVIGRRNASSWRNCAIEAIACARLFEKSPL